MAGTWPAIHAGGVDTDEVVDGRAKPGHDTAATIAPLVPYFIDPALIVLKFGEAIKPHSDLRTPPEIQDNEGRIYNAYGAQAGHPRLFLHQHRKAWMAALRPP